MSYENLFTGDFSTDIKTAGTGVTMSGINTTGMQIIIDPDVEIVIKDNLIHIRRAK
jgi:hypothetical protein